MDLLWMYEYFFETKFIQGCRAVSFHCLLRLLAPLLSSETRCWQHWRHAIVTSYTWEAFRDVADMLAGKTAPCFLSTNVFLSLGCQRAMQGQVPRSPELKMATAMKWKWLISGKTIISVSVPENSESARLKKRSVHPWMGDVSLRRVVCCFCSWQGKGQSLNCKQLLPGRNLIKADVRTWLKSGTLAARPWSSHKKLFSDFSTVTARGS